MNDLIVVPQTNQWSKLKMLVLDSVSSPITRRVYNLGLDEFFAWYSLEPRPGFTKATVSAWRVALEAQPYSGPRVFTHVMNSRLFPPKAPFFHRGIV
jgi:hypothetical protein